MLGKDTFKFPVNEHTMLSNWTVSNSVGVLKLYIAFRYVPVYIEALKGHLELFHEI